MDQEVHEMTQEEAQQLRQQVAAELEAEESGQVAKPLEKEISTEANAEAKVELDPWAGVNPTLKTMFDEMKQKVSVLDETQNRLRRAESRIGNIANEFSAAKKAAEQVASAPTKGQMAEAAKSEEAWNELKEEFPEWATATDARINFKLDTLRKELSSGSVNTEALQQEIDRLKVTMRDGTAEEIQRGIVSFFHPDWEKTITGTDYQNWLKEQPEDIVSKTRSVKAVDAVAVLDAFEGKAAKKTATEIVAERKNRLRTSVLPEGRKAIPAKSEADMTAAELRATIGAEIFAQ